MAKSADNPDNATRFPARTPMLRRQHARLAMVSNKALFARLALSIVKTADTYKRTTVDMGDGDMSLFRTIYWRLLTASHRPRSRPALVLSTMNQLAQTPDLIPGSTHWSIYCLATQHSHILKRGATSVQNKPPNAVRCLHLVTWIGAEMALYVPESDWFR